MPIYVYTYIYICVCDPGLCLRWLCKQLDKTYKPYASTLILVNLTLVNLVGGLVTTHFHEGAKSLYCSRLKATSLPDLRIPTRNLN